MKNYLIYILSGFALSLVFTAAIIPLLKKVKAGQYILGYVKEHKDKSGTPTMGGLAFVCATVILSFVFNGFKNKTVNLTLIITAGFMLVGFLDDSLKIIRRDNGGLKPYQKIVFQFLIATAAAVYCYVNGITKLYLPFFKGAAVDVYWGIIPLVLFIFLATVNCVNLTDGLDGLAGGTGMMYILALGVMTALRGGKFDGVCFIAVGALAAFLLFNVNKAAVFMGDTGSLALGGLIACVTVFSGNSLYLPVIGITFVLSGISVIVQVIYYKRTKRRIFLMAPIHHHFQMKGYTECKIAYTYALITAFAGIICIIFM